MTKIKFKKTLFLTSLLSVCCFLFYFLQNYEIKKHFSQFYNEKQSHYDFAEKVNSEIHRLRREKSKYITIKNGIFGSEYRLVHYIFHGTGLCAHRALLFMTVMNEFSIPTRKLLIGVTDNIVHHIIAEAKIEDKWLVFDPLFGYSYNQTKQELKNSNQVLLNLITNDKKPHPSKYPIEEYHFNKTTLFNWNKISLSWKLKSLIGKNAERFSPPYYFYRPLFLAGLFFGFISIIFLFIKTKGQE